ncbi:MAG: Rho termination factor N-terminal domain-containing protein, partial [Candidatus Hydrogenedentes bacterium]|nr:Rho termination factor N-terminal domain-containing protein [Candidatus Hydrogenedentota bacterium]
MGKTAKKAVKKTAKRAAKKNTKPTTTQEVEDSPDNTGTVMDEASTVTALVGDPGAEVQNQDSQRDAVSEEEAPTEDMHAKYEAVKKGQLHITDLQKMSVAELHELAKNEGIEEYVGVGKQELVFRIIKARVQKKGMMYGEGVLEILPDGFGFLRSTDYN